MEDLLEDSARKIGDPSTYEPDAYLDHTGAIRGNADDATSFDAGHGLVDAVAALDAILRDGSRTAPMVCAPSIGAVQIDDPVGDPRVVPIDPSLPAEAGRDVARVTVAWEVGGRLTIDLELQDLARQAGGNELFGIELSIDGQGVGVDATRSPGDAGTFTVHRGAADVQGSFDSDADVIRYLITPAVPAWRASLIEAFTDSTLGGSMTRHDRTTGACTIRR